MSPHIPGPAAGVRLFVKRPGISMSLRESFLALPFAPRAFVCFVATMGIDIAYALHTIRTATLRPGPAATWGVLVYVLGAVNVVGYSEDLRLLGPIVIGGWLGTYCSVWREARQVQRQGTVVAVASH